ncbi:carbon monoxide dehydrogenase [bacterium M00.F.Ca.ET.228.01.1.1]|uniref:SRPBCC family protein n=1 Tax=Paraburkholderia phenoliruptrix TaxID=252970 RepID=UPI0010926341|nr:carbon monoxide dehydrogenase subunit G [Paraburkholderia phenoliruptrix]TGP41399.1 carbon monoxide dehydrogenase [bacterium M00.F.Ca.ET.228.01.1.1]TGR98056.1 carbon monoxide dehydrogenase [bacterium M00.F.Ca.ET.191.01.1.1]TGU02246.1 carbon monoxide dehydrogenase [bacterium M00.F.Ca.ET.155.01.1.1]MBW0447036.1 carbon monoxide dehydrogenase subunit G [Paraburkholderia phenoliruptrix]MBW9101108.1 carbon monoxide dehydrogenase subunit G [Paraburkholderia phenoliruptrix]
MEFTGSQTIAATREQVWKGLNDAAVLQACVPGCEEFVAQNDDEYKAVVVASVGPVKARFKGTLQLCERDGPNGYRIVGSGEGGVAGFGKMAATVTLADAEEGGTLLTYVADAQVGGKLAQIGSRLVTSVANKLAAEFFKRFNATMSAQASAGVAD